MRKESNVTKKSVKRNSKRGTRTRNQRSTQEVQDIRDEAIKDNEGKPIRNDVSWYFSDAKMASQFATFSCDSFTGVAYPFTTARNNSYNEYRNIKVPSFMRYYLNPSPGYTVNGFETENGLNALGMKLYTFLSANNAKTTQYAPQDITTLILYVGEIISLQQFIRRGFGLMMLYNQRNRAFARGAVNASGIEFDSFADVMANERLRFNTVVSSFNKIPLPSNVPYFAKCNSLYETFWADSESPMGQYYIPVPYSTWRLDETGSEQGTVLRTYVLPYRNANNATLDMTVLITLFRDMVRDLQTSATFNYIYADLLRLSNSSNFPLLQMPYLDADYVVTPEYNPLMLYQIHNSCAVGGPVAEPEEGHTTSNDVYPDMTKLCLTYKPQFTVTHARRNTVVDFPHSMGEPDVAQRIELTRLQACGTYHETDGVLFSDEMALYDHYVVMYRLIFTGTDTSLGDSNFASQLEISNPTTILNRLCYLMKFDYAPLMFLADTASDEVPANIIGDLDFFTTLPMDWHRRMANFIGMELYTFR